MKVVVIGGGFAGLAAAIALQERRHQVWLVERRGLLGGRATSYRDAVTGDDVDSGTHLMVGAYAATFDLLRRVGAEDLLHTQENLRIDYAEPHGGASLDCPPIPAPWHLLWGLLGLRIPWSVRWRALRLGLAVRLSPPSAGVTLADYMARHGQGPAERRWLWDALAVAIVNQVPEQAAAGPFCNAFREAFLQNHRASRLVFIRRGMTHLHQRLAQYLLDRGGMIDLRCRAGAIELTDGRVRGVRTRPGTASGPFPADAVIAAVPWRSLLDLLPATIAREAPFAAFPQLGASPIVSVELWLNRPVLDRPMLGLSDPEFRWVFDKGWFSSRPNAPQHLSLVCSAAHQAIRKTNSDLQAAAEDALRRALSDSRGAQVVRKLVIREPEATFAQTPEAERARPGPITPVEGLFLAGDWTNTGLPATIEGAVRSGYAAAQAVAGR